tara:strand:- start:5869 stop:5994 length:126 start_codon:yes stop_codon:yes gene_type:complete
MRLKKVLLFLKYCHNQKTCQMMLFCDYQKKKPVKTGLEKKM